MVGSDAVGNIFHQQGLTCLGLSHDEGALALADEVILSDIYAAREINTVGVSSNDIIEKIREKGTAGEYIPEFEDIALYLKDRIRPGDLLITMGAGEAHKVGNMLMEADSDND